MIDITKRRNIIKGLYVKIQSDNGKEHKGYVKEVLSKGNSSKGIRVTISSIITNSLVEGIVVDVPSKNDIQKETFKFYNLFFSGNEYYTIVNEKSEYFVYDTSNKLGRKRIILIFNDVSMAKSFLSKNEKFKDYNLKRISKKNTLQHNFEDIVFDYYLLNDCKLVNKNKFNELEKYFFIHN